MTPANAIVTVYMAASFAIFCKFVSTHKKLKEF